MSNFPFYKNTEINNNSFPKITIVIPSYNQGQFIEETILSIIHQNYPNLEFFIFDGGSTDNTVEIIKKYELKIDYWQSEKDKGQADAINQGFEKSTGDIICWINSDDFFLPGSLLFVYDKIDIDKEEILFGNCIHFNESHTGIGGSNVTNWHNNGNIRNGDYIIQPSSFFTRKAWQKTGKLNISYNYVFDWEWFIRAQLNGVIFIPIDIYLSAYRIHSSHKTSTGNVKRQEEYMQIVEKYSDGKYLELLKYIIKNKRNIDRLRWILEFLGRKKSILNFIFPFLRKFTVSEIKGIEGGYYIKM